MSGGYNPKVSMPNLQNNAPPLRSGGFQKPFFFGGAQTPTALGLRSISGSGVDFKNMGILGDVNMRGTLTVKKGISRL
jgi:hypothetical protein